MLPWATPTTRRARALAGSYALLVVMLVRNRAAPRRRRRRGGARLQPDGDPRERRPDAGRAGARCAAAGARYHVHNNSIELVQPQLALLVDRWAAPHWLPLANVFSVGDVLIGLGTLVAVVIAMQARPASDPAPTADTAAAPRVSASTELAAPHS